MISNDRRHDELRSNSTERCWNAIADEADVMSLELFSRRGDARRKEAGRNRTDGSGRSDRGDGARARSPQAAWRWTYYGEEMGGGDSKSRHRNRQEGRPTDHRSRSTARKNSRAEFPTFGTLLGIERDGEIVAGMASAPALATRWWACRGEGAYRNGREDTCLDYVDNSTKRWSSRPAPGQAKEKRTERKFGGWLDAARNSRAIGGFWQHMLVAEGAIDAALDWTSKPWDLAPLGIIVEEAGGRSTNVRGERTIYTGDFLSTNGLLHEEAMALLRDEVDEHPETAGAAGRLVYCPRFERVRQPS